MKNTMNSRDISRYHKYLQQDVSLKEISKVLKVTPEILKKLTPEKCAEAKIRTTAVNKAGGMKAYLASQAAAEKAKEKTTPKSTPAPAPADKKKE